MSISLKHFVLFFTVFIFFGWLVLLSVSYFMSPTRSMSFGSQAPQSTVSKEVKVFGFTHSWVFPKKEPAMKAPKDVKK